MGSRNLVLMNAKHLGGYSLIEKLGEGGMGAVYLGVDEANNPVAVKVLHPNIANDEAARARLGREVRTLRRIHHPRIAEVLDAELESETPFIVTEFVDGMTLSDDVKANGPFAEDELVHFGHALLDALNAVHAAGVIHRDLKPANVMIMDGEPMVIDFGIAQAADEIKVTATGLVMGTPGYLSPEIVDGKTANEKSDWWGWAATMAYAATGRNAFGSGPLEAVIGRVATGRANLDGAPERFVPLLRACLDPKPERRPSGPMILEALVEIEENRMPSLGSPAHSAAATSVLPAATAAYPGEPRQSPQSYEHPYAQGAGQGEGVAGPAVASATAYRAGQNNPGYPQAHPQQMPPQQAQMQPQAQIQQRPPAQAGPGYGPLRLDRPEDQVGSPVGGPAAGLEQAGGRPPAPRAFSGAEPFVAYRARGGRWGVLAIILLGCAMVPLGPCILVMATYLWQVVARATGTAMYKRNLRAYQHGPSAVSGWTLAGAMPGAIAGSLFTSLFSFILPLIAAVAVAVLMHLDVLGIVPPGQSSSWALWAAGAACGAVLWLGPGSAKLRRGSLTLVTGVSRSITGELILSGVLGVLAVVAIFVILGGAAVTWWPLPANPFNILPGV